MNKQKHNVHYRVAGYDPKTEYLEYYQDIPLKIALSLVSFGPDDPEGYYGYEVAYPKVLVVMEKHGIKPPPMPSTVAHNGDIANAAAAAAGAGAASSSAPAASSSSDAPKNNPPQKIS